MSCYKSGIYNIIFLQIRVFNKLNGVEEERPATTNIYIYVSK